MKTEELRFNFREREYFGNSVNKQETSIFGSSPKNRSKRVRVAFFNENIYPRRQLRNSREDTAVLPGQDLSIGKKLVCRNRGAVFLRSGRVVARRYFDATIQESWPERKKGFAPRYKHPMAISDISFRQSLCRPHEHVTNRYARWKHGSYEPEESVCR